MQTVTKQTWAWVSDMDVWHTHEAHMPSHVMCDTYADVSMLLRAVCSHSYDVICVHAALLAPHIKQEADLGSVVRTMCGIQHDQSPHVVILIDAHTDANWLKVTQTESYLGILPHVGWQSVKEFSQAVQHVTTGAAYWPKKMWSWYVPHKVTHIKGTFKLTPRQAQVLHMIQTRGSSNKVIAKHLKISESTVKVHIGAIMKKFGVRNRTQLAVSALQQKM
jgi:DNA-binding NarL/FixJ family response regulator